MPAGTAPRQEESPVIPGFFAAVWQHAQEAERHAAAAQELLHQLAAPPPKLIPWAKLAEDAAVQLREGVERVRLDELRGLWGGALPR